MRQVEDVAAAGVVDVEAPIVGPQPIVAGVVEAAEGQGRAQLVALGRVVEDDIEDDLEAGRVQGRHHGLELGHRRRGPRHSAARAP